MVIAQLRAAAPTRNRVRASGRSVSVRRDLFPRRPIGLLSSRVATEPEDTGAVARSQGLSTRRGVQGSSAARFVRQDEFAFLGAFSECVVAADAPGLRERVGVVPVVILHAVDSAHDAGARDAVAAVSENRVVARVFAEDGL